VKFHSKGAQYFDDGGEAWIAVGRKGLVETLASHASFLREIGHAFGPRHDAKSMGKERRVTIAGGVV
jgi:hypothetical protein